MTLIHTYGRYIELPRDVYKQIYNYFKHDWYLYFKLGINP
jgi:hypothetical protein